MRKDAVNKELLRRMQQLLDDAAGPSPHKFLREIFCYIVYSFSSVLGRPLLVISFIILMEDKTVQLDGNN